MAYLRHLLFRKESSLGHPEPQEPPDPFPRYVAKYTGRVESEVNSSSINDRPQGTGLVPRSPVVYLHQTVRIFPIF